MVIYRRTDFELEGADEPRDQRWNVPKRRGGMSLWLLAAAACIAAVLTPGRTVEPVSAPYLAVEFGPQVLGSASEERAVTVMHTGSERLMLGRASVSGPEAVEFEIARNNCSGAAIEGGGACAITLRFRPLVEGIRRASVSILDASGRQVRTVSVTGVGITLPVQAGRAAPLGATPLVVPQNAAPAARQAAPVPTAVPATPAPLAMSPAELSYSVRLFRETAESGSASRVETESTVRSSSERRVSEEDRSGAQSRSLYVTNSSYGAVLIRDIRVSGPGAGVFQVTANACPGKLPPRTRCEIWVRFKPESAGSFAATLAVEYQGAGSPLNAILTGVSSSGRQ